MLSEFQIQVLAAPFALAGLVILALAARTHSKHQGVGNELVARSRANPVAEAAWIIADAATALLIILPPFFPWIVYQNSLSPNVQGNGFVILQLIGYGVLFVGACLLFSSQRALGRFLMREIGVVKTHELITSGPYSRIRHPLYSGFLLIDAGLALFYLNALAAVVLVLAIIGAYGRARAEEQLLASDSAFGAKYHQYAGSTGMFLPKLWRRKTVT